MVRGVWPAGSFERAVAILFALVLLALGITTLVNAPLSFDGAYYLFRVLDTHQFAYDLNRLINIPLQLPVMAAIHFTQDIRLLCLTFSAAYCSVPVSGLAVLWLVCRRRPSLFIWPAMSMCVAALPGQFFFQTEAIMVPTLLWPALLTPLIGTPAAVLPLVAIASVIATASHPIAAPILALAVLVTVVSAITRPQMRRASLCFALFLGLLLIARVAAPLHEWERRTYTVQIAVNSFRNAVLGWPLVAMAFTMIAALICLFPARRSAGAYLMMPLILAGAALVAWAIQPANWAICLDYRYWAPPVSLMLMSGAAVEELWLRRSTESRLQEIRRYAMPLIGAIFLIVLSIQSVQWALMNQRLTSDLMDSDRGCVVSNSVAWLGDTPMDHWGVTLYAVLLQGRKPNTLLLPGQFACQLFGVDGDASFVEMGTFSFVRPRGEGWFDFEDARWKTRYHRRFFEDGSTPRAAPSQDPSILDAVPPI